MAELSEIIQDIHDNIHTNGQNQITGQLLQTTLDGMAVGLSEQVSQLGQQVIYDVSANNDGATFASLSALLSSEYLSTLIPIAVRCGGMSIRFVQSSDNKYVQYRLMADTWSTTVSDWQGVDDEPVAGSKNVVESGGVYKVQEKILGRNDDISRLINVAGGIGADGTDKNSSSYVQNYSRSGFLYVNKDDVLDYALQVPNGTAVIAFYSGQNITDFVESVTGDGSTVTGKHTVTSDGYVRVSGKTSSLGYGTNFCKIKKEGKVEEIESSISQISQDVEDIDTRITSIDSSIADINETVGKEYQLAFTNDDYVGLYFSGNGIVEATSSYNGYVIPIKANVAYTIVGTYTSIILTEEYPAVGAETISANSPILVQNDCYALITQATSVGELTINVGKSGMSKDIQNCTEEIDGFEQQICPINTINYSKTSGRVGYVLDIGHAGESIRIKCELVSGTDSGTWSVYGTNEEGTRMDVNTILVSKSNFGFSALIIVPENGKVFLFTQNQFSGAREYKFTIEYGSSLLSKVDEHNDSIANLNNTIEYKVPYSVNPQPRKILLLGDSILGNDGEVAAFLAQFTGAIVYNCAFGGTSVSVRVGSSAYRYFDGEVLVDAIVTNDFQDQEDNVASLAASAREKLTTLEQLDYNSLDLIVLEWATNDYTQGKTIEEITAAYGVCIDKLQTAFPLVRILVVTNTWRFFSTTENSDSKVYNVSTGKEIANAIESYCKNKRIHVLNMYQEMPASYNNCTSIFDNVTQGGDADQQSGIEYPTGSGNYYSGVHFNINGNKIYAKILNGKIISIF